MNKSLQELKITLLNVGYAKLNKQWNFDNVISPFSRLYLIKNGSGKVYHHQHVFNLKEGYIYLIPAFSYSRYRCDDSMEQYYIHFLEEIGTGLSVYNLKEFVYEKKTTQADSMLFERLLAVNPNRALIKSDPKTYDNRTAMLSFAELNNRVPAADFIETQGILKILLSRFIEEKNILTKSLHDNAKRITGMLYYISEHLAEELTVNELARQCHLNPDYFSRIFKEQTGIRPLEYLQTKRIERAQLLLATTNYSLTEIADMVGLPNISYFSRLFSRISKKPPSAYRKDYWSI